MHEEHKGHDAMHAEMIIILLVTLILAQVALVEWKKRHYRSFSVSLGHHGGFVEIFVEERKKIDPKIVRFAFICMMKPSAGDTDRPVDRTNLLLHKEYVVAFRIFLGNIFLHNAGSDA